MKAREARQLTESFEPDIAVVYALIRQSASKGLESCSVSCDKFAENAQAIKRAMLILKTDGYSVTRRVGSDQRDNESWDYLEISW